jgi:hypothetical protein
VTALAHSDGVSGAPEWLTAPVLAELVAADPEAVWLLVWSVLGWLAVVVAAVSIAVYVNGWRPRIPVRLAVEDDTDDDLEDTPMVDDSDIDVPLDAPDGTAIVQDGPDVLLRPVNEPRPSGWPAADVAPNAGDYFDRVSRRSNEMTGRWITKRQQVQEAQIGIAEFERYLQAQAARRARREASTQEIQYGDPGE